VKSREFNSKPDPKASENQSFNKSVISSKGVSTRTKTELTEKTQTNQSESSSCCQVSTSENKKIHSDIDGGVSKLDQKPNSGGADKNKLSRQDQKKKLKKENQKKRKEREKKLQEKEQRWKEQELQDLLEKQNISCLSVAGTESTINKEHAHNKREHKNRGTYYMTSQGEAEQETNFMSTRKQSLFDENFILMNRL
jgi:hypothetical protein